MRAIAWLGEHGLLDEPSSETVADEATSKPIPTIAPVHHEADTRDATGVKTADETGAS